MASPATGTDIRSSSSGGEAGPSPRKLIDTLEKDLLGSLATVRCATAKSMPPPFTCGIVNAKSGRCQENCSFCAQSAHHPTDAPVHPLISGDEMLRRAEVLAGRGVNYMGMVTSGTGPKGEDFDRLCGMAERIRTRVDIKLCASFGILTREQADRLAASGFSSCHHNLETARSHYSQVCTSHVYDLRTETVRHAKAAGLRVCSGGIFGVGESWAQRVELAQELAVLDVDSIPVNFLTPIPGTPLGTLPRLQPREALSVVALVRSLHPDRDIVICGGRSSLGRLEPLLFAAGANGLMVGDYLTTKGSPLDADLDLLSALGLHP